MTDTTRHASVLPAEATTSAGRSRTPIDDSGLPGLPGLMSPWIGVPIMLVTNVLGVGVGTVIGALLITIITLSDPNWLHASVLGFILWIAFRLSHDLYGLGRTGYIVVERFGRLYRVKRGSYTILLLTGLIDRIPPEGGRGSLESQEFLLYTGDKDAEIDFKDASAPVKASMWFRIMAPPDTNPEDEETATISAILRFVYMFRNPFRRITEVMDGEVRPMLQARTIDEASVNAQGPINNRLCNKKSRVRKILRTLGVELDAREPFVLTDIVKSEAVKDLRRKRLEAETLADADRSRASGWKDSIVTIALGLSGKEKPTGDDRRAAELTFKDLRAIEAIEKRKGDLTLMASSMGGVVKTFGVGATSTSRKKRGE